MGRARTLEGRRWALAAAFLTLAACEGTSGDGEEASGGALVDGQRKELGAATAATASRGASATPTMGFNIYYAAAYNGMGSKYWTGNPSAAVTKTIADDMVRVGLASAGYKLLSIEGWRWSDAAQASRAIDPTTGAMSKLLPRPEFPDMAGLVTYIHGKGLAAGIYTDTGANDGCYTGAGSGSFIRSDLTQFLDWGFDFLKLDHCGGNPNAGKLGRDGSSAEYKVWADTIAELSRARGKELVLNAADWNNDRTPSWGPQVATSWRTGTDIDCYFGCAPAAPISWQTILRNFDKNDVPPAASPGHYNDPDYLLIGMRKADGTDPLTDVEEKSYFGMWAIQAAPLMLATFPAELDPARPGAAALREIVLNAEIIAVDQDPLVHQGEKVREDLPGRVVYGKRLTGSGKRAVLLLNRTDAPATITVDWKDLGLTSDAARVRDLWKHADVGSVTRGYTAEGVPAHGSVMLTVTGTEQTRAASTGWSNLGGKFLGAPAAAWTRAGELTVFARGLDSYVWQRRRSGGAWEAGWTQVPLPALSISPAYPTEKSPVDLDVRGEPGVVAQGDVVHLVAMGAELPYATESQRALFHTWSGDGGRTWNAPENLGGALHGTVSPVLRDASTFDVLGRGADGAIWRRTYRSGWGAWTSLGGCSRSGVAASSRADGVVHLAVVGCNDDAIWHGYYVGDGAVAWERVQGLAASGTPAIAPDPSNGHWNLFARASEDGSVRQTSWDGGWAAWTKLDGCSKSGIAALARPSSAVTADARFDVLATGCGDRSLVSHDDASADGVWQRTAR